MASVAFEGGSETSSVICVVLVNLECLWVHLLNPKLLLLLLGAGGKGEVDKGREEDPSTAVSFAVAL